MSGWVVFLPDLDPRTGESVAGSKMARLAELGRSGIAVPRGFVVTVDAFRARHDHPDEIAEQIVEAYRQLSHQCGGSAVRTAVRSSALGEDSVRASFAGVFDTFLGVSGPDQVVAAVRDCWAGVASERADAYRHTQHIDAQATMAVGVGELIAAHVAGVAFSTHPVTGRSDRIVIEANWGWGESVVQGVTTPDHVEVDKADGRILSYQVGTKHRFSQWDPGSGRVTEIDTPAALRPRRVLTDGEIRDIATTVTRIEEHFGYPVDVEWVLDDRADLTVVQARPITSSAAPAPVPEEWDPVGFATRYLFGS